MMDMCMLFLRCNQFGIGSLNAWKEPVYGTVLPILPVLWCCQLISWDLLFRNFLCLDNISEELMCLFSDMIVYVFRDLFLKQTFMDILLRELKWCEISELLLYVWTWALV